MRIQRRARGRGSRRGVALIYAVFGAFVAAGMVSVMFTMAGITNQRSALKRGRVEARYLAEGGIEAAKKDVVHAIANWSTVPSAGTTSIDGHAVDWTVENAAAQRIVEDSAGIQTIVDTYEIQASVEIDDVDVTAHRLINAESTPVFQFAVFYTNDLEILPGPDMRLGGRVHTNGDMYVGSGATLTMDTNYVHAIGKMFRRRKNGNPSKGSVLIRRWVENPFAEGNPEFVAMNSRTQMSELGVWSTSGYDSAFVDGYDAESDGNYYGDLDWLPFDVGALEYWKEPEGYANGSGYTVQTGAHGLGEATTASIGSIAMFEESAAGTYAFNAQTGLYEEVGPGGTHAKGYYHANAGLSIIVTGPDDWDAFDGAGQSVKSQLVAFDPNVVTLTGVADMRQSNSASTHVPVVSVDMELLNASGLFPGNGLLYAAHYGMGEGTASKGVLLHNGSELQGKLTVVTEGPAYIQGDYNTVQKVGAAVIGDAVNLLSNEWDNSKTPGSLPYATDTTFNCAMITGNYETEGENYNGGLENLPRFHEKWNGVDCNITGSFVNLWESAYATGLWQYGGDRYNAPVRQWSYDPLFNQVSNLPPFTPMAVTAHDVVTW